MACDPRYKPQLVQSPSTPSQQPKQSTEVRRMRQHITQTPSCQLPHTSSPRCTLIPHEVLFARKHVNHRQYQSQQVKEAVHALTKLPDGHTHTQPLRSLQPHLARTRCAGHTSRCARVVSCTTCKTSTLCTRTTCKQVVKTHCAGTSGCRLRQAGCPAVPQGGHAAEAVIRAAAETEQ